MQDPYWHDTTATLYAADPREVLAEMPGQAVDCIVTSAPPWQPVPDDHVHDGYGHEPTPSLYVAAVRRVLAEAHRVLIDEGTCWLTTSDCYATDTGWDGPSPGKHVRRVRDHAMIGLPASSLIGLPWQIAFALQDDGWIVRNAIVWHHPAVETSSAADRLASSYELIFLLVKQKRHHLDLDSIRHKPWPGIAAGSPAAGGNPGAAGLDPNACRCGNRHSRRHGNGNYANAAGNCGRRQRETATRAAGRHHAAAHPNGNSTGDVWTLPAPPFWNTVPIELPLRCIAAGCRPGGTVLDMFAGIATTGLAARELDRSFIGIEQTPDLCRIAQRRLEESTGHADGSTR
jgi:hypothetical protein